MRFCSKLKLIVPVILLAVVFGAVLRMPAPTDAIAGVSHLVLGWGWGGTQNIFDSSVAGPGWVSTNSLDCDFDGDGEVTDGEVLDAPDCTEGPIANYGITDNSGKLAGYAWSENYGWISFEDSDLEGCPVGICNARLWPPDRVYGWARILSLVNPDDTDLGGWVKLSSGSDDTVNYGIKYDKLTKKFNGYAYSDEVGWIDFSPIPDSEIGSITVVPCEIAEEESNCDTAVISWDLQEGAPAYEVESLTTDIIIGTTATPPDPGWHFLVLYGENQVRATASGLYDALWTGDARCQTGLFFNSTLSTPVCKRLPVVTILPPTASGGLYRKDSAATVSFSLLANYDATCTVIGGVPAGTTISHTGNVSPMMYNFVIDPLLSAQEVVVECGVPTVPDSIASDKIRINVLPSYQER